MPGTYDWDKWIPAVETFAVPPEMWPLPPPHTGSYPSTHARCHLSPRGRRNHTVDAQLPATLQDKQPGLQASVAVLTIINANNLATMSIQNMLCFFSGMIQNILWGLEEAQKPEHLPNNDTNAHKNNLKEWTDCNCFQMNTNLCETRAGRKGRIYWPENQQQHRASRHICQRSCCRRVHLWWETRGETGKPLAADMLDRTSLHP